MSRNIITEAVNPDNIISTYLTKGASPDMNVNGSVTPQNFDYRVPANTILRLTNVMIYLQGGTFTWDKFGSLTALANGFKLDILARGGNTSKLDFFLASDGTAKDNRDLVAVSGIHYNIETKGGSDLMVVDLHLPEYFGAGGVDVGAREYVRAVVQDDLSTLTRMRVGIIGVEFGV